MGITVASYVRQFYRGNLYGTTDNLRHGYYAGKLASADIKAIKRGLRDLRDYDYDEGEGGELINKVQAFAKTYNHLIESSGDVEDYDFSRTVSKLKKMTKQERDKLADIGITVLSSGKMKVDKETLQNSSRNMVSKVFSEDAEFSKGLEKQIKKVLNRIRRNNLETPRQTAGNKATNHMEESANAYGPDAQAIQQLNDTAAGSQIDYTI